MRRDFKALGLLVALRKESVDRNHCRCYPCNTCYVALRKESVDRNSVPFRPASHLSKSLSARRAWIEIKTPHKTS